MGEARSVPLPQEEHALCWKVRDEALYHIATPVDQPHCRITVQPHW